MTTMMRSTPATVLLALSLAVFVACDPYEPLICEPCDGGCSDGLVCESGRCIAPKATCGLRCTSLDPCQEPGQACVAGVCVLTCGPDKACEHPSDVCMVGRCVRQCGALDRCGLVVDGAEDGIVASDEVQLIATTFGAIGVELSNVPSFDPDHPSTIAIELARSDGAISGSPQPESFRFDWDLSRGVADCPEAERNACARSVYARFVDAGGAPVELSEASVAVDGRAPTIQPGSVRYAVTAPPGALITETNTLTTRSTASIRVAFDEPLQTLRVRLSGEPDDGWNVAETAPASFVLTATIGANRPEGPHEISLAVTDRVGNTARLPLDLGSPGFIIDRTPPAPVRNAELSRNPWRQPALTLSAPAGAVEASATVIVVDSTGQQVGRTQARPDGGLAAMVLDGASDGAVRIVAVDDAGNVSAESQVLNERYTSAPAGTTDGPVRMTPIRGGFTKLRPADASNLTVRERNATAAREVLMYVEAPRTWTERVWSQTNKPVLRAGQAAAFDPLSGEVVAFGGYRPTLEGLVITSDFLRFEDGAWSRLIADNPTNPRDVGASIVADPKRGGWLLASSGTFASGCAYYDEDTGWRNVTQNGSATCSIRALAYDSRRGRPVGFTSSTMLVWSGSDWSQHGSLGTFIRNEYSVVYNEAKDEFVAVEGDGRTLVFGPDGGLVSRGPSLPERFSAGWDAGTALRPALAYDAAREQVVVLFSEGSRATLWALGDDEWVALESTGPCPEARMGAALAYDPGRARVVMVGGLDLSGHRFVPGAWAWNGTRWLSLQPTRRVPTARPDPLLVHERHTGRTLLLGYYWTSRGDFRQRPDPTTWVWDGHRWWDTDIPVPDPGFFKKAVYHEGLQRVVALSRGQAWTWEQTAWVPLSVTGTVAQPNDLSAAAVGYDGRADALLAFGVGDGDELWTLDASGWRRIPRSDPWPPARWDGAFVDDTEIGRMVLFGGRNDQSPALNDMWRWDGTRFSRVTGIEAFPAVLQEANPRAVAFDEARRSLVAMWGDTAVWFDRGAQRWNIEPLTHFVETLGVPNRSHAMAFDARRRELLLFGGFDRETGDWTAGLFRRPIDIWWQWQSDVMTGPGALTPNAFVTAPAGDGLLLLTADDSNQLQTSRLTGRAVVDDVWHGPYPADTPMFDASPRSVTVARHAARSALVMFSGADGKTWVSDGRTWSVQSGDGPSPRSGHAMTYDAPNQRVVLFGGQSPSGGALDDMWAWDGTWSRVPNASPPAARFHHAMTYDPVRQRVVLFGGEQGSTSPLSDTWVWDGTSWMQISGSGPSARTDAGLIFDEGAGYTLLVGGNDGADQPLQDTWAFDGRTWWQPDIEGTPNLEHAVPRTAGYDPVTGDVVTLQSYAMTGLPAASTRRPGVLLRWDVGEIAEAGHALRSFEVHTIAGGRGFTGADEQNGVEVALYNAAQRRFVRLGANDAASDSRAPIRVTVSDDVSDYILNNRYVYVRVQTVGGQDGGRTRPVMTLEAAELTLGYTRGSQP